jgi:hypothetical protein
MFPINKKKEEIERKTVFQILAAMFSKFISCVLHTSMALKISYCK